MNPNTNELRETIVGLADLVREVRLHGRTARFDSRAPALLEEARLALSSTPAKDCNDAKPGEHKAGKPV